MENKYEWGHFDEFTITIFKEDEENLNPHLHLINDDKDIPVCLCTPNGYFHTGEKYKHTTNCYKDPFDTEFALKFDKFMETGAWFNLFIAFCSSNNIPVRLFTKPSYINTKGFYYPPYPHTDPPISSEFINFDNGGGYVELYSFENMRDPLHFHIFKGPEEFVTGSHLIYPICIFDNKYYGHDSWFIEKNKLSNEECEVLDKWMRTPVDDEETNWTRTIDHLYMMNPQSRYIDVKPEMQPDYTKLNKNDILL